MWSTRINSSELKNAGLKGFVVLCYAGAYALSVRTGISCIWKHLLGFPCPGCGFTSALLAALRGDLREAMHRHPLFWLFPLILVLFIRDGRLFKTEKVNIALMLAIGGAFIIVWVIRLAAGDFS